MARMNEDVAAVRADHRILSLVLGLLVPVLLVYGCGGDDEGGEASTTTEATPATRAEELPDGTVATVDDTEDGIVAQEDFDAALSRAAEQQGLGELPADDDPQYQALLDQTMSDLLLPIWIAGEAEEMEIILTDQEIEERARQIVAQSFSSPKEFEEFVVDQGFCTEDEITSGDPIACEGVRRQVSTMLYAERIQEEVLGANPSGTSLESDAAAEFEEDFTRRWRERTICASEVVVSRCANGPEEEVEASDGGALDLNLGGG